VNYRKLKNSNSTRDLKYLVIDLMVQSFNLEYLSQLAREAGVASRLGYLAEVAATACEQKGIKAFQKLYSLAESLYSPDSGWQHLNPNIPDFAKRILMQNRQGELNRKWRIYSTLQQSDISDWISLYEVREKYAA